MHEKFRIGVAGWSVPRDYQEYFQTSGSHLIRYASRFNCVEINSSFYKEHQAKTYLRWAESVPENFKFSLKLSKIFTHEQKLKVDAEALELSLANLKQLGAKLGVLLVQLPGSQAFEKKTAGSFFKKLRKEFEGKIAIEPRHLSWAEKDAQSLYQDFEISKVIADPERVVIQNKKDAFTAASAGGFAYFRLHGSPIIYRSRYELNYLEQVYAQMKNMQKMHEIWCIFDNTTFGHSAINGVELQNLSK